MWWLLFADTRLAELGDQRACPIDDATLFHDALMGVKFLHNRGWMHYNLKPENIGVARTPLRSLLLDVGSSWWLPNPNSALGPWPGNGGTITYLAPERELQPFTHLVDIWAMGIVGYELTYGVHPFSFIINPWRKGEEYEGLRPEFGRQYDAAIKRLANDCTQARASPTIGYIHREYRRPSYAAATDQYVMAVGYLIIKMLRHPWANGNREQRININEVLSDPAWGPFLDAPERAPETKKARRE